MPDHRDGLYRERYRPGFHFTARENWLNDPNGMVYFDGEYHLFFQYNAKGRLWGPNSWGHAVSTDLVRWTQLADAIAPDDYGWIWSGSAVVDWENSSGFGRDGKPPLVALYTTGAGGQAGFPATPCVQALAYSTDRGRTWTRHAGNPVLGHIVAANRDPKVIWDRERGRWVMALYLDHDEYALFASPDLLEWRELSRLHLVGDGECPDFFPLKLDGDGAEKWIFCGANNRYRIGSFDGTRFLPDTEVLQFEQGRNFYASQTFSDSSDGRRIQIAWMNNGEYPDMPFNQQMSFPCELGLRSTPAGPRLVRAPVAEIAGLRARSWHQQDVAVGPLLWAIPTRTELVAGAATLDVTLTVDLGQAHGFELTFRGEPIRYDARLGLLICRGMAERLLARDGRITLRFLFDRTSIEVFGDDGAFSLSVCTLFVDAPATAAPGPWWALSIIGLGAGVRVASMDAHELASAWPESRAQMLSLGAAG